MFQRCVTLRLIYSIRITLAGGRCFLRHPACCLPSPVPPAYCACGSPVTICSVPIDTELPWQLHTHTHAQQSPHTPNTTHTILTSPDPPVTHPGPPRSLTADSVDLWLSAMHSDAWPMLEQVLLK
ncbi:hypothetical protein T492DRAFT_1082264 [Pavlovales sp. CCMP2436]|nr:hypothetical protein T492DRAFT_1082264 [Pavlovales sp. CCMP2436]